MKRGGPEPFDWQAVFGADFPGITPNGEAVEKWLFLHPHIAASMFWLDLDPATADVSTVAYPWWPPGRKAQLAEAVYHAYEWLRQPIQYFGGEYLQDPPTNQIVLADEDPPYTGLTEEAAWKLYLATVAHTLALELGGFVPWSITGYNADDIATLVDARRMFVAGSRTLPGSDDANPIEFTGYLVEGYVIPAPPTTSFPFLVTNDIVQGDHFDTIARLLGWGHAHMNHFAGLRTARNFEAHWQYRGYAPASRIMAGTTYVDPETGYTNGPRGWTPACHGVAYFFSALLRAANIPVRYMFVCGHGVPVFWTIGHTMSHGDDVYVQVPSTPQWPAEMLLVHKLTFMAWFCKPGSECVNIGRRPKDIALEVLADELLERYCHDLSNSLGHAEGSVFEFFEMPGGYLYTVEHLEAMGLWEKLAAKAAQLGLCGA